MKKGILPFAIFWFIASFIIIARLLFDVNTCFFGSTLYYHNISQSGYDYMIHLPKGYTDFDGKRPLIIFLHGAGETNKSLQELERCDLVHYAKGKIESKDFPFIVVSPVTPIHGWQPERVVRLLDELLNDKSKRWQWDDSGIYLTGMSMGGFGTFRTACEYPEHFAAIVPVAGGGEPELSQRLTNLPTWAFHGDADDVVPYECSMKMIEKMNEIHCKEAKLTTLHGAGHGIMGNVYSKPELYRWLIEKRKRVSVHAH